MDFFHNFSAIPLWCEEEFVNGHYCRTMCPTQKWRTQWGQCVVLRLKNEGHNEDIVCENHRRSCAPRVTIAEIFLAGKHFISVFLSLQSEKQKLILPQKNERLSYLIYMRKNRCLDVRNIAIWRRYLQQSCVLWNKRYLMLLTKLLYYRR